MRRWKQIPIEETAVDSGLTERRLLMEAVKVSHKTQMLDKPNTYGYEWYPVGDELKRSMYVSNFIPKERVLRIAQVTFLGSLVTNAAYRQKFISRIRERGAGWMDGMQFDRLPIDSDPTLIDDLARLREQDGLVVVLQCHRPIMENLQARGTVEKLGEFARAGAMDYVLFDMSEGKGRMLIPDEMRPFLEEAFSSDDLGSVGIGVAGGLDGERVRTIFPVLLAEYPDIFWDAESRLHDEGPVGNWFLDLDKAEDYLIASSEVLRAQP